MRDDLFSAVKRGVTFAQLLGVEIHPGKAILCPFHNEKTPSFRLHDDNHGHCFGCGWSGTIIDAEMKLNPDPKNKPVDAAIRLAKRFNISYDDSPKVRAHSKRSFGLNVEQLADAKRLPVEFLEGLGVQTSEVTKAEAGEIVIRALCDEGVWDSQVSTSTWCEVLIRYHNEDGTPAARHRRRYAISGKRKQCWAPGDGKPVPYGLNGLADARKAEALVIVEGESDVWTLRYHDFPCLGLPGASTASLLRVGHFKGIGKVFICEEPDDAGKSFVQRVCAKIRGWRRWHGEIYVVRLEGAKDVSELHIQDPDAFNVEFQRALDEAELAPEEKPALREMTEEDTGPAIPETILKDCTDTGNAELLATLYGDTARYDHARGRWLLWRSPIWAPDEDGAVDRMAIEAARERYKALWHVDFASTKARSAALKWADSSRNEVRIRACLKVARNLQPITDAGHDWDSHPMLLAANNGVIDLETGKLRDGCQGDKLTLKVPINYEPSALCPLFENFLMEIFDEDLELVNFVLAAIGYSITGDTGEQCLFFLYGCGANGKGVLTETLRYVFGEYADDVPFSTLELDRNSGATNDLAKLIGKRFVTASEGSESRRLNEARLKALTGCDSVTARFLYREFFTFRPVAKFWLAANHKPPVRDTSEGFWRRIRMIPFQREFKGAAADKDLIHKLRAEAPGILTLAVRCCLDWQKHGLKAPASVLDATDEYREESDPLARFVDECCDVIEALSVPASTLYKGYHDWAESENMQTREILTNTAFGRKMTERFQKERIPGSGKRYLGIGLRA
ncbi:MAG: hypothetical protein HQ592_18175 [Planctomycetes bacterium]|nr:hypothetical protein [Planctomycetota bacterium]